MERALDTFLTYQREAEERFQKQEEQRWKRETELEERRRKEDQEHEKALMGMLASMLQPRPQYPRPSQDLEDCFPFYSQH